MHARRITAACIRNHIARYTGEHTASFASIALSFVCGTSTARRHQAAKIHNIYPYLAA
jgi:hypothetical protein